MQCIFHHKPLIAITLMQMFDKVLMLEFENSWIWRGKLFGWIFWGASLFWGWPSLLIRKLQTLFSKPTFNLRKIVEAPPKSQGKWAGPLYRKRGFLVFLFAVFLKKCVVFFGAKGIAHGKLQVHLNIICVGMVVNMDVHGFAIYHWSEQDPVMSIIHRTCRSHA